MSEAISKAISLAALAPQQTVNFALTTDFIKIETTTSPLSNDLAAFRHS